MKKKIIITGANGLVGQKLILSFKDSFDVLGLDVHPDLKISHLANVQYAELDITEYNKVKEAYQDFKPDHVINAAGFTNVDKCEDEQKLSWRINVTGPKYLAELCRRHKAHFTHISSDYVFDGKNGPYSEDDGPNPISYYGEEKLASEQEVVSTGCRYTIFRGIVIYGHGLDTNPNFATWLMNELGNGRKVKIVTDQWGNTTLAEDVARGIKAGIMKDAEGFFHIGNKHFHSRYDFSVEIAKFFGYDRDLITPVLTKDLKQKASRPLRSGLVIDKIKSDLGYDPFDLEEGFQVMKEQVQNG